jgi:hypothetical protein
MDFDGAMFHGKRAALDSVRSEFVYQEAHRLDSFRT